MKSFTHPNFWELYSSLLESIKRQAKEVFKKFQKDPYYPSLCFKRVHSKQLIFAVRITKEYRAVGIQHKNEIIWFWIGSHSDYDKLLKKLRRN